MEKRKKEDKSEEYYLKKIRKLHEKLKNVPNKQVSPTPTRWPPPSPSTPHPLIPSAHSSPQRPLQMLQEEVVNAETLDDDLPEEYLLALGTEGQEKTDVGEPIRTELASRWKKIMTDGLGKEPRECIVKKYPTPSNFPAATAPMMNPELLACLSEPSVKRDKRITARQNLTGSLMACLGKSLTNIMKGNINTRLLIEEINDAAKMAAEIHYHDSASKKYFALAGATKTVQDALRHSTTDKFLFGKECSNKIKAAQNIQRASNTLKNSDKKSTKTANPKYKQLNWKSPPQYQQPHRPRGGHQQHHPPRKHLNQPHRKEGHNSNYKPRSRYRR